MNKDVEYLREQFKNLDKTDHFSYLIKALDYASHDPQSSLTKSRIFLEKTLKDLYQIFMQEKPTEKITIGQILSNKKFISKLPPRIGYRMNAIREMSNLGPHGV